MPPVMYLFKESQLGIVVKTIMSNVKLKFELPISLKVDGEKRSTQDKGGPPESDVHLTPKFLVTRRRFLDHYSVNICLGLRIPVGTTVSDVNP